MASRYVAAILNDEKKLETKLIMQLPCLARPNPQNDSAADKEGIARGKIKQGRPEGGVEYQNTRNKPSNIPKITLKLVSSTKIKKTTVYFIPQISCE